MTRPSSTDASVDWPASASILVCASFAETSWFAISVLAEASVEVAVASCCVHLFREASCEARSAPSLSHLGGGGGGQEGGGLGAWAAASLVESLSFSLEILVILRWRLSIRAALALIAASCSLCSPRICVRRESHFVSTVAVTVAGATVAVAVVVVVAAAVVVVVVATVAVVVVVAAGVAMVVVVVVVVTERTTSAADASAAGASATSLLDTAGEVASGTTGSG